MLFDTSNQRAKIACFDRIKRKKYILRAKKKYCLAGWIYFSVLLFCEKAEISRKRDFFLFYSQKGWIFENIFIFQAAKISDFLRVFLRDFSNFESMFSGKFSIFTDLFLVYNDA